MFITQRTFGLLCVLLLGLAVNQAWGQGISLFSKEDILLVGGDFRIRSVLSNIAGADADRDNDTYGGGESGGFPTDNADTKSFIDTRLRLYWDFRPNELLRVSYRMEIGDIRFGGGVENGSDVSDNLLPAVGPGSGGEVGADGVNVETKDVFLEFSIPAIRGLKFRGGIFGYGDRYNFNILADDFAGFQILYERGDVAAHFVYLKFYEGDTRQNADDSDWFGVDGALLVNRTTRIGTSFYFWAEQKDDALDLNNPYQMWAGADLTSEVGSSLGPVLINGFVIYNQGEGFFGRRAGKNHGWNLSLSGDLRHRIGTFGLQVQYITGEKGSKCQIEAVGDPTTTTCPGGANDSNGNGSKSDDNIGAWLSYYNNMYGGPEITSRGPVIDIGDGFNSKWGTGNGFFNGDYNGRLLVIARSAIPIVPQFSLHLVGTYDRSAQPNENGDHERGYEIDLWAQWDILPKLWLRFGGGYYFTGDWWKNNSDATCNGLGGNCEGGSGISSDPDNVWQFGTRLQYNFG